MSNIFDYVHWRGDLSFNKAKFNELDNIIFTQICYVDFSMSIEGFPSKNTVLLKDAINKTFELKNKDEIVLGLILPFSIVELTDKIKDKKRYANLEVSNYVDLIDKDKVQQFSAMCFHLSNDLIYICFRGTDDSVIGWQEDLDMVCKFPVPSQQLAVEYVNKISSMFPSCNLIIGGHSKGGNLANYAAIYCDDDVKEKIVNVYNNDGPGFVKEKVDLEKFESIKNKIVRIIPSSSVIGITFQPFCGKTKIVDSDVKGIRQHDIFSWQVDVKKFVYEKQLTENAKKFDDLLSNMIYKLSEDERIELSKNIYDFFCVLNKDALLEIQKDSITFLKQVNKITSKTKKLFMELIYNLIKCKML